MNWTRGDEYSDAESEIWNQRLDFGHDDLMLLDLLIKRAARDAEAFCGLFDAPALLLKHPFDVLLFQFQEGQTRIEERSAHLRVPVEVQVVDRDRFLVTQQHGAFYYISQLANVAGPCIGLERLKTVFIQMQFTTAQVG